MTEAVRRTWALRRRLAAAWLHDRSQFAEPRLPRMHIPDDRQAMRELFRLLRLGGVALLTVPLNASRRQTYENPAIAGPAERHAHFTARDHVRYCGLDFADRLAEVGFTVTTFRLTPEEEVRCGLLRDESLYVATKP